MDEIQKQLSDAIKQGDIDKIGSALVHGSDVNYIDSIDESPLGEALRDSPDDKMFDVVRFLVEHGNPKRGHSI